MGAKRAFELFPGGLKARSKEERRRRWDTWQRGAVTVATAAVAAAKKVRMSFCSVDAGDDSKARGLLGGETVGELPTVARTARGKPRVLMLTLGQPCWPTSSWASCSVVECRLRVQAKDTPKKELEELELRVKLLADMQEKFEDLGAGLHPPSLQRCSRALWRTILNTAYQEFSSVCLLSGRACLHGGAVQLQGNMFLWCQRLQATRWLWARRPYAGLRGLARRGAMASGAGHK